MLFHCVAVCKYSARGVGDQHTHTHTQQGLAAMRMSTQRELGVRRWGGGGRGRLQGRGNIGVVLRRSLQFLCGLRIVDGHTLCKSLVELTVIVVYDYIQLEIGATRGKGEQPCVTRNLNGQTCGGVCLYGL